MVSSYYNNLIICGMDNIGMDNIAPTDQDHCPLEPEMRKLWYLATIII